MVSSPMLTYKLFKWVVRLPGPNVLLQEVNGKPMLEVGYHLMPFARGRGIAREISSYLVGAIDNEVAEDDFSDFSL